MAALQTLVAQMATRLPPASLGTAPASRLTKQTPEDDVEAYLEVFERVAEREAWPGDQWANIIAPFLTGSAQRAYQDLRDRDAADYPTLKAAILAQYGHNLAARAQRFHSWEFNPGGPVRTQVTQLVRLTRSWLMTGEGPTALDRIVMDRCIRALPTEAKKWAAQNQPDSVDALVQLLENHQVAQEMMEADAPTGRSQQAGAGRKPANLGIGTRHRQYQPPEDKPAHSHHEKTGGVFRVARRDIWPASALGKMSPCHRPVPGRTNVKDDVSSLPAGSTRSPTFQICQCGWGVETRVL